MHLVRYGLDEGLSRGEADSLVLGIGIGGMAGRILISFAIDLFGPDAILSVTLALVAVANALLPFAMPRYHLVMAYAVIIGSAIGEAFSRVAKSSCAALYPSLSPRPSSFISPDAVSMVGRSFAPSLPCFLAAFPLPLRRLCNKGTFCYGAITLVVDDTNARKLPLVLQVHWWQ